MEIPHFVYICVNWWTVELFSALAIMINAAMNSYVQVFVWTYDFISLEYIPRDRLAGYRYPCLTF